MRSREAGAVSNDSDDAVAWLGQQLMSTYAQKIQAEEQVCHGGDLSVAQFSQLDLCGKEYLSGHWGREESESADVDRTLEDFLVFNFFWIF